MRQVGRRELVLHILRVAEVPAWGKGALHIAVGAFNDAFDSGSLGRACTISVPIAPANAATASHRRALPMPASRSHTNRLGTALKSCPMSCHIPAIRPSVERVESRQAAANRECDAAITSTGSGRCTPFASGNPPAAKVRSHWISRPGRRVSVSTGSAGRYSSRIRATFLRSHDSDPVHPMRCPITFALRRGVSAHNARTCRSKASKLVVLARRGGYFGGESEASAHSTVFFAQPTSHRREANFS
mgnify:CR=1 FL=1